MPRNLVTPFAMKPWTGPSLVWTTGLNGFSAVCPCAAATPGHAAHSVPSATARTQLTLLPDIWRGRASAGSITIRSFESMASSLVSPFYLPERLAGSSAHGLHENSPQRWARPHEAMVG